MRVLRGAFLVAAAALLLNSCSQLWPVLYLVNHSGDFVRILHASSEGRREDTLAWWGDPWSYFAVLAPDRGRDLLGAPRNGSREWIIQIGANGCRAWYEIPIPEKFYEQYLLVRIEPDLQIYFAGVAEQSSEANVITAELPDQPIGFPVRPTGRDCS